MGDERVIFDEKTDTYRVLPRKTATYDTDESKKEKEEKKLLTAFANLGKSGWREQSEQAISHCAYARSLSLSLAFVILSFLHRFFVVRKTLPCFIPLQPFFHKSPFRLLGRLLCCLFSERTLGSGF